MLFFLLLQHGLQFSRSKGRLRIIIPAQVFTLDKDAWDGPLSRHGSQRLLNGTAVGHAIQFVYLYVRRQGSIFGKEGLGTGTKSFFSSIMIMIIVVVQSRKMVRQELFPLQCVVMQFSATRFQDSAGRQAGTNKTPTYWQYVLLKITT